MATSIDNGLPMRTAAASSQADSPVSSDLLICLPPMSDDHRDAASATIASVFPGGELLIGVTHTPASGDRIAQASLVCYEDARSQANWALHAADYLAAAHLARKYDKRHILLLGSDMPSAALLASLSLALAQDATDIVLPQPRSGPHDGLVNSAILYPLSRALFGHDIRFPLPQNIGLSKRALERVALDAQRDLSAGRNESLLWPVSVSASSGLAMRQVETEDQLPAPQVPDFNRLFTDVIGSLMADTEVRAIYWQRSRYTAPSHPAPPRLDPPPAVENLEVGSMLDAFRVAHANLLPIWSLVLPPQSLLALKKLAAAPAQAFLFPPELWARLVYDFALAFHLRTINRNHLVGALIPLYLAWAASHIQSSSSDPVQAEQLVHQTAAAFESEKPYFVSCWRWPDRFNP